MDIAQLTIHGFKSFYEKSVFTFGKKITAIVGPNGSGKSNVAEAVRFVLGEQGVRSLRAKEATDMLFRGNTQRVSKAKVEILFKKDSNFKILEHEITNVFVKNALEKDEVVIARTLYADGKSVYEINGVEVRLKDVHEFLLLVHLGNKGSWHISQGEADRVLSANQLERKTLIEDALGLKIYHARIHESNKKLEKTKENIREASLQRKEILPELSILSRTVERIKRAHEFRTELLDKAGIFLAYKKEELKKLTQSLGTSPENLDKHLQGLQTQLKDLEVEIGEKQAAVNRATNNSEELLRKEIERENKILAMLQEKEAELKQKTQKVENILSYSQLEEDKLVEELKSLESELSQISAGGNEIIFSEKDVKTAGEEIEKGVESILRQDNVFEQARKIDLAFKHLLTLGSVVTQDKAKQALYLQSVKSRLQERLRKLRLEKEGAVKDLGWLKPELTQTQLKIRLVNEKIAELNKQILESKYIGVEREKDLQILIFKHSQLQTKIAEAEMIARKLAEGENELKRDLFELENLVGKIEVADNQATDLSDDEFYQLKRQIERLKLRLEESQVANPEEVLTKHKELQDRDEFLLKEIADLEKSMQNLEILIDDLRRSLSEEFTRGLEKINTVFDGYIKRLFGGGGGRVFVIEIEDKKRAEEVDDEVAGEEKSEEKKLGIEVEVELPKKKIKGLHSLSGGERALVSIALNFSIIQEHPAPFMILDETDAALDEANSKRFGEMLEMLKEKTKLIVVTHNRETMHFADQIYGVTLHKDGYSKTLSVSFDDAVEYAK